MASRGGNTTRGQDTPGTEEPTGAAGADAPGTERQATDNEATGRPENIFAEETPQDQDAADQSFPEVEGSSVVEPDAVTPRQAADTIDEEKLAELAEAEVHVEPRSGETTAQSPSFPEGEGASVLETDAVTPRQQADTIEEAKQVEPAQAETQAAIVEDLPRGAETGSVGEAAQSSSASETTQAPVAPPAQPRRSGGFLGPLLGGILAAALGYGMAIYGWTQNLALPFLPQADGGAEAALIELRAGISAEAEARAAEIAALQAELEALRNAPAAAPDTAALEERLAAIEAQVADPAEGAEAAALATLQDRLAALEARPAAAGGELDVGELDALRATLSSVQAEVERLGAEAAEATAAAQAAAEAAEAELASRAAEAEAIANRSAMQAALAQLSSALESGAPLAPGLDSLEASGIVVPEALDVVRDGVPTLAALQASYPEAARAALSAAMATDSPEDPLDRVGSFLRAQVGLRSLSPREGEDADAILSRAEAALRAGDLATTLAEIETLPDAAKPPLAGWQAQARERLAAVEAVDAITTELDPQ